MTVLNPPIAVQGRADHAADDLRGALMAGMVPQGGATVLRPRQGVMPGWGAELAVSQRAAGANMSVDVAAGICCLQAPTNGHGGWYCINDGVLNLTIAAAHATLPRIDLVIARVADAQYHTGGDGAAAVKVITGVAAASPVAPTVPVADGAFVTLGQVAVAAAAASIVNANITLNTQATVPRTVTSGGILPVPNLAGRPATPYEGQAIYQMDTDRVLQWNGTVWAALGALAVAAVDPAVRQGAPGATSAWGLGDFGAGSGDTDGRIAVKDAIVDGWQLAVQSGNGPTFPPAAAGLTYAQLPVAPTALPNRWVVGEFFYQDFSGNTQGSGVMRYDTSAVAGQHWARLSAALNSNNQFSLALKWRYPLIDTL